MRPSDSFVHHRPHDPVEESCESDRRLSFTSLPFMTLSVYPFPPVLVAVVALAWHHFLFASMGWTNDDPRKPSGNKKSNRIGWITPINQFDDFCTDVTHSTNINWFGQNLVSVADLNLGNFVALESVPRTEWDASTKTIKGVCAPNLRLGRDFRLHVDSKVYRGVCMQSGRWHADERKKWLKSNRHWVHSNRPLIDLPILSPAELPSDVILVVDPSSNWMVGSDWNVDGRITPDESVRLSKSHLSRPAVMAEDDWIGIVEAKLSENVHDRHSSPGLTFHFFRADSVADESSRSESLIDVLASTSDERKIDLVLIPTGHDAAALSSAMHYAAEHCDFVVACVRATNRRHPRSLRLLAQLSQQLSIALLFNRRTHLSPNYLVEPSQNETPNVAASTNANQIDETEGARLSFADAVTRMLRRPSRFNHKAAGNVEVISDLEPTTAPSRLQEKDPVPRVVEIDSATWRAESLSPCQVDLVPTSTSAIVTQLTDRKGARSWWYQLPDPRDKPETRMISLDPSVDSHPWRSDDLQFWYISNNGRVTSDQWPYEEGWMLVQAARTKRTDGLAPPKLVQLARISSMDNEKKSIQARSQTNSWIDYYQSDALVTRIRQQRQRGQSAQQILDNTRVPSSANDPLALKRAYLHALDQIELRKSQLDEVVIAADQVLDSCQRILGGLPIPQKPYADDSLASHGDLRAGQTAFESEFPMKEEPQWLLVYAYAVDAAYRKVRAIGYRELPDVVDRYPIVDWEIQNRSYDLAFEQLCGLTDVKDSRFVLPLVRYHRRRQEFAKAYRTLKSYGNKGPAVPWYFKKERDLWNESGVASLSRLGNARWFLRQNSKPILQNRP